MDYLPGFGALTSMKVEENSVPFKKGSKKSGGFQSMGLNFNVLKGITKRGYKVPTPIQRKVRFRSLIK